MEQIAQRLAELEDRLTRLLASGWRAAAAEAQSLGQEAQAVREAGLEGLADRLQAVADARSPAEGLAAVAMASAALRMLRVRLAADAVPPGAWEPLTAATAKKKRTRPDRLAPVTRFALEEGEVWACVKLRGSQPERLLLLTPPDLRAESVWLKRPLEGRLRWEARYPLGAGGEVDLCRLEEARWGEPFEGEEDPLPRFRQALGSGKLKEEMPVFAYGGPLRVAMVDPGQTDLYVWPDGAALAALRQAAKGKSWGLAWTDGALVMPLALLAPGGLLRKARLMHLIPGGLSDTV